MSILTMCACLEIDFSDKQDG